MAGEPQDTAGSDARAVPVVVCDAVKTLGIHNGLARIEFIRLAADGTPIPSLELLMPAAAVPQIVKALQSIR